MGIYIGNLPTGTTTSDLLDFLEEHPSITDIELVKRHTEEGEVRFGHILLDPSTQAKRVIEQQRQTALYGSPVVVREYIDRSNRNDRRSKQQAAHQNRPERRASERRWKPTLS
jgi:RNA recognition motif-containing protein